MALRLLRDERQSNDRELEPLLVAAVERAARLGRPFTEDEVLAPVWAQGWDVSASMVRYFALAQEATGTTRRYWTYNG